MISAEIRDAHHAEQDAGNQHSNRRKLPCQPVRCCLPAVSVHLPKIKRLSECGQLPAHLLQVGAGFGKDKQRHSRIADIIAGYQRLVVRKNNVFTGLKHIYVVRPAGAEIKVDGKGRLPQLSDQPRRYGNILQTALSGFKLMQGDDFTDLVKGCNLTAQNHLRFGRSLTAEPLPLA